MSVMMQLRSDSSIRDTQLTWRRILWGWNSTQRAVTEAHSCLVITDPWNTDMYNFTDAHLDNILKAAYMLYIETSFNKLYRFDSSAGFMLMSANAWVRDGLAGFNKIKEKGPIQIPDLHNVKLSSLTLKDLHGL